MSNVAEDEDTYSEEPSKAIGTEIEDDDEEDVPWLSVLEGTIEMLEYAQGKRPAFVTKYVDGKRVSAQWQMMDGTKVDPPDLEA